MNKIITCKNCNKKLEECAKGLCRKCYDIKRYIDNPEYKREQFKKFKLENPEYKKNHYKNNLEYYKKQSEKFKLENPEWEKNWRKKNPTYHKEKDKEFEIKNPGYHKRKSKERCIENPEYMRNYSIKKYHDDINFKLKSILSAAIHQVLKGNYKSARTIKLLGCTIPQFKHYIESQWLPGMSWDNWCLNGWHIDHIKPKFMFDLSKSEEQQKCFHYTNQRPLWCTTEVALANGCDEIGNMNREKAY